MSDPMKNVTVRLSDDEIKWLMAEATKEMRTLASLIRWIIAEYRQNLNDVTRFQSGNTPLEHRRQDDISPCNTQPPSLDKNNLIRQRSHLTIGNQL